MPEGGGCRPPAASRRLRQRYPPVSRESGDHGIEQGDTLIVRGLRSHRRWARRDRRLSRSRNEPAVRRARRDGIEREAAAVKSGVVLCLEDVASTLLIAALMF